MVNVPGVSKTPQKPKTASDAYRQSFRILCATFPELLGNVGGETSEVWTIDTMKRKPFKHYNARTLELLGEDCSMNANETVCRTRPLVYLHTVLRKKGVKDARGSKHDITMQTVERFAEYPRKNAAYLKYNGKKLREHTDLSFVVKQTNAQISDVLNKIKKDNEKLVKKVAIIK